MNDSSLIYDLSVTNEQGMADNIINLNELMLCDIPNYLNLDDDESNADADLDAQMDALLDELTKPMSLKDFLPENLVDFGDGNDANNDGNDNSNNGNGDSGNGNNNNGNVNSDENDFNGDNNGNGDSGNSSENGNGLADELLKRKVILEFAADTIKYHAEPFRWNVEPGESINKDTILAYCQQGGEMMPIKSIFSKGVVRKDENDGDFWRCWKTVSSRHIVIDDVERCPSSSTSGMDYESVYNDPSIFTKMGDTIQQSTDAFTILHMTFPYVLYLKLIVNEKYIYHKERKWYNLPLVYAPQIAYYETLPTPESVFTKYIKNQYIELREDFQDALLDIYGGANNVTSTIKATNGDMDKLKAIGNKVLSIRNNYFERFYNLYKNCENYYRVCKGQFDWEETWKFNDKMDFKLFYMTDDAGGYKEVNGSEDGETFKEYFDILQKSLVDGQGDLITEFKNLLKEISDLCIKETDDKWNVDNQKANLKEWIKKYDDFLDKCYTIYNQTKITKIPNDILKDGGDDVLSKTFKESLSKIAEWPEDSGSYYYEPTKETFDEHYIFLNIDEMNSSGNASGNGSAGLSDSEGKDNNVLDNSNSGNLTSGIEQQVNDAVADAENNSGTYSGDAGSEYDKPIDIAKELDNNNTPADPDITTYAYWLRYFGVATLCTIMFLATGIPLPYMTCIPLPCIYIPLSVLVFKQVSIIMVLGIAIRGVSISPIILWVNIDSKENSILLPLTLSIATLKDKFQNKINKVLDLATNSNNLAMAAVKTNQKMLIKQSKEYEAKISALKGKEVDGYTSIVTDFKKSIGEDTKQIVARLSVLKDEAESIVSDVTSGINDVSTAYASVKSGTTKEETDTNSAVSPSIV